MTATMVMRMTRYRARALSEKVSLLARVEERWVAEVVPRSFLP
jgi:hypothetical protein